MRQDLPLPRPRRIEYFDCELPRTRRLMEDPEGFLEARRGRRLVLDEIHRLANPSELLKIDADLADFGSGDLSHRLLHGGLPPFRLERRWSFQRFLELLFAQSGGMFEATRFATPCEVSRQTISNYLSALEATFVAHVVRPYSTHRSTEIMSAPKVYGFDTGFVCFYRGWDSLRPEDLGYLWEHFVLNEIQARLQRRDVRYWRNKRGAEVDFVLPRRGEQGPVAVECKWRAASFEAASLAAFRRLYPDGPSFVVAPDVDAPYKRSYDGFEVDFVSLERLIARLAGPTRR
jgi:predicted AAA+ superfamily ATPase